MVITIAGGGSTFTAGIVKSIALRREELEVDEIRLFDINKERQDKVAHNEPFQNSVPSIPKTSEETKSLYLATMIELPNT